MDAEYALSQKFPVYSEIDYPRLRDLSNHCYPRLIDWLSSTADPKKQPVSDWDLRQLDDYRYNLHTIVSSRCEGGQPLQFDYERRISIPQPKKPAGHGWLELEELKILMEWKLRKGTNRPTLRKFIASNTEVLVERVTYGAFTLFAEWEREASPKKAYSKVIREALEKLCRLKGVGPATASLILSVAFPEKVAFFSDELYTWAVDLKHKSQKELDLEQAERRGLKASSIRHQMPRLVYDKTECLDLLDSVAELHARIVVDANRELKDTYVSAMDIEKAAFTIIRVRDVASISGWTHEMPQIVASFQITDGSKELTDRIKDPTGRSKQYIEHINEFTSHSKEPTEKRKRKRRSEPETREEVIQKRNLRLRSETHK